MVHTGTLELLCGPSGVGKSSSFGEKTRAYTYTTRNKRPGETDGIDRRFVSESAFEKLLTEGQIIAPHDFLGNRYGFATDITQALKRGEQISEQVVCLDGITELKQKLGPDTVKTTLFLTHHNDLVLRLLRRYGFTKTFKQRVGNLPEQTTEYVENLDLFDDVEVNTYDKQFLDANRQDMIHAAESACIGMILELFDVPEEMQERVTQYFKQTFFPETEFQNPFDELKAMHAINNETDLNNLLALFPQILFFPTFQHDREGNEKYLKEHPEMNLAKALTGYNPETYYFETFEQVKQLFPLRMYLLYHLRESLMRGDDQNPLDILIETELPITDPEYEMIAASAHSGKRRMAAAKQRPFTKTFGFILDEADYRHNFDERIFAINRQYSNYLALRSLTREREVNETYVTGAFNGALDRDFEELTLEQQQVKKLIFAPLYLWELEVKSKEISIYKSLSSFPFSTINSQREIKPTNFIKEVRAGNSKFYNRLLAKAKALSADDLEFFEQSKKEFDYAVNELGRSRWGAFNGW
ncbi:hypothetical protein HN587_03285 [Candidatus Woesearchaeota archaeon]|jgi:guanylate kinase|nr:hypothetical protein [Candidatus Woesearchaeota archaeon]